MQGDDIARNRYRQAVAGFLARQFRTQFNYFHPWRRFSPPLKLDQIAIFELHSFCVFLLFLLLNHQPFAACILARRTTIETKTGEKMSINVREHLVAALPSISIAVLCALPGLCPRPKIQFRFERTKWQKENAMIIRRYYISRAALFIVLDDNDEMLSNISGATASNDTSEQRRIAWLHCRINCVILRLNFHQ